MHRALFVAAAVALAAASGCRSVPSASLPALAAADPLVLDPGGIRAAVVHPKSLTIPSGAAVLTLVLSDGVGGVLAEEAFVLAARPVAEAAGVRVRDGERATVLALVEADIARFAAMQEQMRARRQSAPGESSLSIHVSARPCRTGEESAGEITTYVRLAPSGRYVAVSRPSPLPGNAAMLPSCGARGAA